MKNPGLNISLLATMAIAALPAPAETEVPDAPASLSTDEMITIAVNQLVSIQEDGGMWPYEGVYRVGGEIPIGYRVGGTAIAGEALLFAAKPSNKSAQGALDKGIAFILKHLEDPLMQPSRENRYDVRVWGHAYALQFFCHLLDQKRAGQRQADVRKWVDKLTQALIVEQLEDGGWNYATRRRHASFVTAPVVQALLYARTQGAVVPQDVFERAGKVMQDSRESNGAFHYSGTKSARRRDKSRAKLPGSIARSPICEATLLLIGDGSTERIKQSIDAFHEHWDELEKRRKQHGTHVPPYGIAPYYFYFAHRYAAQAIELLPEKDRKQERARFLEKLLRTRDEDGTWNDRVFPRSRNYGTAMSILALLGERTPMPHPLGG